MTKTALLFGGSKSEYEVSVNTAQNIIASINQKQYQVFPIEISPADYAWYHVQKHDFNNKTKINPINFFQNNDINICFLAVHGKYGEDGTLQGFLDAINMPYTGSGVLTSAIAFDKNIYKQLLFANDIKTAKSITVYKQDKNIQNLTKWLGFPLVIKPTNEGSSAGVFIIKDKKEFGINLKKCFSFAPRVIVEKFIKGTEVTCGVLGNKTLPIIEIQPINDFFDYESKYSGKSKEFATKLDEKTQKRISDTSLRIHKLLGAEVYSRMDFIVDQGGSPFALETNTLPGLTNESLFPKAACLAGTSYSELLDDIIQLSLHKPKYS